MLQNATASVWLSIACTGVTEVTGSNPVEALIFFRLLHSNCLKAHLHPRLIAVACFCFEYLYCPNA